MLKTKTKIWLLLLFVSASVACTEDDPEVSSEPTLNIQSVVTGLPGESIVFSGMVSDPAGVTEIMITYENWSLSKVITVDEGVTQFPLSYSFKVPDLEEVGSTHVIEIAAKNVGGKITSTSVTVELSQDNIPPSIAISSPSNGGTFIVSSGPELNLTFTVSDNAQLSSVRVLGMGINELITPNASTFNYDKEVDFLIVGPFTATITATDMAGNVSTASVSVNIEESLKFTKFYLVDVDTEAELATDVFGVPLLTNGATTATKEGFEFEALYYNKEANTEIRFIPQKESFEPFSFGAGDVAGELALGSDNTVAPIILPEVGYYRIVVDIAAFTYTMETYTPTDDTFDFVHIMGRGIEVNDLSTCIDNGDGSGRCWHFLSGKEFTVDPSNPYRFTASVELFDQPDDEGANGFILGASPSGWAPFWRFDAEDSEVTIPGDGANFTFGSDAFGTYTFEFDTHLNRARLLPQ